MRLLAPLSIAVLLFIALALPALAAHHSDDKDYNETINGTKLHFRVRGTDPDAPYLLILHGGPGFSAHMFYPWGRIEEIESWFNVVYLDQRGSGESARLKVAAPMAPKPEEVKDYTMATLIADIEGVRKRLKIEKWYVLGHSWGGMLGLEYVVAHPEHVTGYIHMDGLVSQPQAQEAMLNFAGSYYGKQQAAAKDDAAKQAAQVKQDAITKLQAMPPGPDRLTGAFSLLFADPALFQSVYYADPAKMVEYQKAVSASLQIYKISPTVLMAPEPGAALEMTEHYSTRDDTPLLSKVTVPTLIINGRDDHLITPAQATAVHDGIKNSTLIILENCGHFPFVEQPERVKAALLAFLTPTRPE